MALGASNSVLCECIRYLREIRGVDVRGDAWTIPVTHKLEAATVGDVLLFDTNPDHGAEIIGTVGEVLKFPYVLPEYFLIAETNWKPCTPDVRLVSFNDPRLKGVYRPIGSSNTNYAQIHPVLGTALTAASLLPATE